MDGEPTAKATPDALKVALGNTQFDFKVPVTTSTKEVAVPMKILITTYLEVCKIADGILLCNHVPRILNKHFRGKSYYVDVVDLFNEHIKSFLKWVKIGMGRYGRYVLLYTNLIQVSEAYNVPVLQCFGVCQATGICKEDVMISRIVIG
ncbi:FPP synthase 1 [Artemisia annua]|uniref:FPP synthase 1 n=1 Tax=Artemisia annua TaxID=35608 RepID=A0A2U1NCJ6_ARTAN|nr:FPP synthase 1 [Artemisia annua]